MRLSYKMDMGAPWTCGESNIHAYNYDYQTELMEWINLLWPALCVFKKYFVHPKFVTLAKYDRFKCFQFQQRILARIFLFFPLNKPKHILCWAACHSALKTEHPVITYPQSYFSKNPFYLPPSNLLRDQILRLHFFRLLINNFFLPHLATQSRKSA